MDPATIAAIISAVGSVLQAMKKRPSPSPSAAGGETQPLGAPPITSLQSMARNAAPQFGGGQFPPANLAGGGGSGFDEPIPTPYGRGTTEAHKVFTGSVNVDADADAVKPTDLPPGSTGTADAPPGGGAPGSDAAKQKMTVAQWLEAIGGAAGAGAAMAPDRLQPPQPVDFGSRSQVGGMSPTSTAFMSQPRSVAEFLQLLMRR